MRYTMGININDDDQPFTEQILSGKKTIETRNTNSLKPYVGKRVGIVSTSRRRKALLVGYADVGEPIIYCTRRAFDRDRKRHRIESGSRYDIKDVKFGYPLTNVVRLSRPRQVRSKGIIARRVPIHD